MAGDLTVRNIKVTDRIEPGSAGGTVTLGNSINADTIAVPSGVTLNINSGATFSATAGTMSGQNYPAFEAEVSSTLTLTSGATTLAPFDTEIFDTDNMYDNSASNYKFTPTIAGKYFVYGRIFFNTTAFTVQRARIFIYKNGSLYGNCSTQFDTGNVVEYTPMIGQVVEMNGSTDYLQLYVYMTVSSGTPRLFQDTGRNAFGAYRIGA